MIFNKEFLKLKNILEIEVHLYLQQCIHLTFEELGINNNGNPN